MIGNFDITYAGIQVPWTYTSDKRWKSDIRDSHLGLDFISKLRPVSYYRNNDESKKIFEENFAPFKGNSKWVMIIIFSLLAFYIIAANLN